MFFKKTDTHSKYQNNMDKGHSQYKSGQYRDALKFFEKAITFDPQSYVAWNWKGSSLRRLGRYEEAIKCYDHAIFLDKSSYPFPHIGKGDIFFKQKLIPKALTEYNRAIKIKRHPWALNGKAHCLYETGKKDQAFRLAEEVIQMRPSFVFPDILEGDIFSDRGSYNDALKRYDKALSLTHLDSTEIQDSLNHKKLNCRIYVAPDQVDIAHFMHLLSTGTNQERADASDSLDRCVKNNLAGQIIRQRPFSLFERSLQDPVPDVRQNILWALGNLACNSYSHEVAESEILCRLVDCLHDPSEDVRSAAAWSLAVLAESGQGIHVAETGMVSPCIRLLDDPNAEVREMAAFALDKVSFYASPEPLVRENGIVALARHIMDGETSVREKNLWALWSVASRGYSNSLCEIDMLITDLKLCAQSRNPEIRKAAISIIGELSTVTDKSFLENKDLERILITGIGSKRNRVRGASVWAIGRWVDAGLSKTFTRNGAKDLLKTCYNDQHKVHVFYHNEKNWKQRSIGGIAGDVLKKFDSSRPVPTQSSKSDYQTAYFIAKGYVDELHRNELQNACKSVVHLEHLVSGSILSDVQKQRGILEYYLKQEIEGIPEEFENMAEISKEMILVKTME
ncbi:tetratricopeptide repeat protein [Methanogenium sp. MK-MG]|uniref:tetratricopeptide repeat protein n=1 Tax=Methanogenium sp. MK-MG TaxID=2599926 RepID=UPI0013EB568B|nr:tetratricopeptide repeat protein [Methanogenium sp. MK-MG]KAF1078118.1 hypothetical protein MKMG_00983 [Methanogenium sp. MK-MG]